MTDIVELDEHRPHISGPVVCTRCRHKWVAVRPIGTDLLECPACGANRGASLDTMLHKPHLILGAECCGQRDGDGVCAAPACLYGDALTLVQCLRDASHLEYLALRAENSSLSAWQCVYTDGKTGLVGDEHGNQYCAMAKRVEVLRAENERLKVEAAAQYADGAHDGSDRAQDLWAGEITALRAEVERLRAALREAYEVYAGSDGFIPETAAEGYQQQIIKQMVDCISAALEESP